MDRGVGLLLGDAAECQLITFFRQIDQTKYVQLCSDMLTIPRRELVVTDDECRQLVAALSGVGSG
jgi:hypothetical protein